MFTIKYLDGRSVRADLPFEEVLELIKSSKIESFHAAQDELKSKDIESLIKTAFKSRSAVKMDLTCYELGLETEGMLKSLPGIQCTILDVKPRVINLDESTPITTRVSGNGEESYGSPGNEFTIRYLDKRVEKVNISLPEIIKVIKGNMIDALEIAPHRQGGSYIDLLIKTAFESLSSVKMDLTSFGLGLEVMEIMRDSRYDIKVFSEEGAYAQKILINSSKEDILPLAVHDQASASDVVHLSAEMLGEPGQWGE